MFRISDILKKHKKGSDGQPPKKRPEEIIIMPDKAQGASPEQKKRPEDVIIMGKPPDAETPQAQSSIKLSVEKAFTATAKALISKAINQEMSKEADAQANFLYDEVLAAVKHFYTSDLKKEAGFLTSINSLTEKTLSILSEHGHIIQWRCLLDYPGAEDYLYRHSVNVYFLSLGVGVEFGVDRDRLIDLGTGAFLHDIGLAGIDDRMKAAKLEKEEHDNIQKHPNLGVDIMVRSTKEINEKVLKIIKQAHERADGSGYPEGLVADDISILAQIVGLVDVYEALTHRRPYRPRYTPLEALDIILKNKKLFGPKIIKSLINSVGVYPVGTPVLLSSKETGVVTVNHPDLLFRPVVSIVSDPYGDELTEPKDVDLTSHPILYIEDCVKEKV
ncbi:MAG: HD domain-containing protein [Candidatus Omnitrophica bacterium]|nr:HD domain-containing protein [Candidatus Omnitrophota bacterium]